MFCKVAAIQTLQDFTSLGGGKKKLLPWKLKLGFCPDGGEKQKMWINKTGKEKDKAEFRRKMDRSYDKTKQFVHFIT